METEVHWIDARPNLQSGIQPVVAIERPLLHGDTPSGGVFNTSEVARSGRYWVPQAAAIGAAEIPWTFTDTGQYVRIPVFAYRTRYRAASGILAAGVEIGLTAALSLARRSESCPSQMIVVLGHECVDLAPAVEAYRCFVGFAFRTET